MIRRPPSGCCDEVTSGQKVDTADSPSLYAPYDAGRARGRADREGGPERERRAGVSAAPRSQSASVRPAAEGRRPGTRVARPAESGGVLEGVVAQRLDRPALLEPLRGDRGAEDGHEVSLRAVVNRAQGAQVEGRSGLLRALRPRPVEALPYPGRGQPEAAVADVVLRQPGEDLAGGRFHQDGGRSDHLGGGELVAAPVVAHDRSFVVLAARGFGVPSSPSPFSPCGRPNR